jgi:hypothetical protein
MGIMLPEPPILIVSAQADDAKTVRHNVSVIMICPSKIKSYTGDNVISASYNLGHSGATK